MPRRSIACSALFALPLGLSLVLAAGACAPPPATVDPNASHPLRATPTVYTLVNLHPDEDDRELSSVNYQDDGFIPLCTPIRVTFLNTEELDFTILATGRQYRYLFHDTMKMSPGEHVARFFGTRCDPGMVATLEPLDQQGVRQGKALVGMSKEAVLLAIGYPPDHATPSLDANEWRYWESLLDTFTVVFVDGKVAEIRD